MTKVAVGSFDPVLTATAARSSPARARVWAAVFLGESVTLAAVLATVVVIGSICGRNAAARPSPRPWSRATSRS
jgi:hypothetical protein